MQHLEVSGAVRHTYVIRQLRVKIDTWIIWDKRNWQHWCSQFILFICIKYWL